MYLSGQIAVDPSQVTSIVKTKPTKGFAKMAHFLTGGLVSKKEEQETFTAVAILQNINMVLRAVGGNNIVKLAKDDVTFYEDTEGKEDDLQDALNAFLESHERGNNTLFNTLSLVLEHPTEDMQYLMEIRINRTHEVGAFPITLVVNGLIRELAAKEGESADDLKSRMAIHFESQDKYDAVLTGSKASFELFLDAIEEEFRQHMKIDSVERSSRTRIICSKEESLKSAQEIGNRKNETTVSRHNDYHDPLYYGYYGYNDYFFYSWLWSDMCHDHSIHVQDVSLVTETGGDLLEVDEKGVDMAAQ